MRAAVLLAALAACAPEIFSGSYLCGPDGACPDGLVCSAGSNTCVLPSQVEPFDCKANLNTEPDNTAADAHVVEMGCVSTPVKLRSCLLDETDTADWVTFVAPSVCTAVEVQVRLSFPVAFEELGFDLWDVDANMPLAKDGDCAKASDIGDVQRCLDHELVPGRQYGIQVRPTGEGTCDGACAYNRYLLTVQLATPG